MKKILFCTVNFHQVKNGPTKFIRWMYEELKMFELDIDFRVLTTDSLTPKERLTSGKVFNAEINIPFYKKPIAKLEYAKRICRRAEEIRADFEYDVIVFNNVILSYYLKPNKSVKVIGLVNDFKNIDYNTATGANSILLKCSRMVLSQIEKRASKKASLTLANSQLLKQAIVDKYGLHRSKVEVLYKGVEVNKLPNERFVQPIGVPVNILFVKTDHLIGGLGVLLKSLELLKIPVNLSVIGPNKSIQYKYKNIIGRNVNAKFYGALPQEDVFAHMSVNDIFCVPSISEALGVANMEAAQRGCALVSTCVGGIPEVLKNGEAGWMVEPNNPQQLCDSLQECIIDDHLRHQKKKIAYEHVVDSFSKQKTRDKFLSIIMQI